MPQGNIKIEGARQNNLKNLSLSLPLGELIVLTGVSGSGKTSLAFQTLYAEGQRRYAETFSPYARQFLERSDKPAVDRISGIPPAIAIGQANNVRTSRSTVGTMTEIADHLKLLFTHMGTLRCPHCGREVKPWAVDDIFADAQKSLSGQAATLSFAVCFPKKTPWKEATAFIQQQGYLRVIHDGTILRLDELNLRHAPETLLIVQDRISKWDNTQKSRITEALSTALEKGKGIVRIHPLSDRKPGTPLLYSSRWYCPYDDTEFSPPTPGLFSFNNPLGACPECRGFGRTIDIDYQLALPNRSLSIKEGVVKPFQTSSFAECQQDLLRACKKHGINTTEPFSKLPQNEQDFIIHGELREGMSPEEVYEAGGWYGVEGFFRWLESRTYKMHVRVLLSRYRSYRTCPTCGGSRFREETSYWQVRGKTLLEINSLPLCELQEFFHSLQPADNSQRIVLDQITSRLSFLVEVGLGYLNLNRTTRTLSGGEFQRVNLTTCLGTSLVGTLFVLDEPSIGLHPRDTGRLIQILKKLRDRGNTVIVVEHDEEVISNAGHILELGPLQGSKGGEITFQGSARKILRAPRSLTGQYLSGKKTIPTPTPRKIPARHPKLTLKGASCHNIRDLTFSLPLKRFVAITGVSGSGKSTLVHNILYLNLLQKLGSPGDEPAPLKSLSGEKDIREVHLIDQSPLSRTPRSTPVLYMDAFDPIRNLLASTDEARRQGLTASAFSFNSGTGRCERCMGTGYEKVSMQFLSDIYITCPQCEGRRFRQHVCEVLYNGKGIHDILSLTVDDAIEFFDPEQAHGRESTLCHDVRTPLRLLQEVGLGYLLLGQPLNQLSGGEAQRLKLVSHLKASSEKTHKLFILDEPTTGLHLHDISILLRLLQRLVDEGNSLVVIEHHLDVIKSADWILDLGPEAGSEGGRLVAQGTPSQIASHSKSITGTHLKSRLSPSPAKATPPAPPASKKRSPGRASANAIEIHGARHHNLKNISLNIPRNRMVVVTGLSGSGKSTLAFDLLFSEGQRRYLDCLNSYARQFIEQLERPDVDSITGIPPSVAIEQRTSRGGGKSTVATVTEIYQFLRLAYAKLGTLHDPDTHEPAVQQSADDIIHRITSALKKEKELLLLAPAIRGRKGLHTEVARWAEKKGYRQLRVDGKWIEPENFKALDRYREHDIDILIGTLQHKSAGVPSLISRALEVGKGSFSTLCNHSRETLYSTHLYCPGTGRSFEEPAPNLFSYNSPHGWCPECKGYGFIVREADSDASQSEQELQTEWSVESRSDEVRTPCPHCGGTRLNPIARAVRLGGTPVPHINSMTVGELAAFFKKLRFTPRQATLARDILPEIEHRLRFLEHVGLGYLALDRPAPTLSGGEAQRIRLASQLGSNLQGVLYVLDEPSIGLHPRDNQTLLTTLRSLQQKGNSLIVVEHDEDTMREADHILDLGPGAGTQGGELIAQGSWKSIARQTQSVTGMLLGTPLAHPLRGQRRPVPVRHPFLTVKGAHANNLKNVTLKVPHKRLTVMTGVSGSGKSTLMRHVLMPAVQNALLPRPKKSDSYPWKSLETIGDISKVIEVDQAPIGKTSRSTVATYIGIMDDLRALFASLPEAKARGFTPSHFSHNSGSGRCETCKGQGTIKVDMNFLPPTYVPCETCQGRRWSDSVLDIRYHGRNIYEVLQLSISEALEVFESHPRLKIALKLLAETGLGYLTLGQTSPTLSGGEAQRIKLITELAAAAQIEQRTKMRSTRKALPHYFYLLEEPTVGLHLADVKRLIDVLHQLVDSGHTVLVIEHNTDIMAEADWMIDVGPEGGDNGGRILANGTPEKVSRVKQSRTAPFLAKALGS